MALSAVVFGLAEATALGDEPPQPAAGNVVVSLRPGPSNPNEVSGRVVVRDQSGGVLIEDPAGVYWSLEANSIVSTQPAAGSFERANATELAHSLSAAAGGPAVVVTTDHYVIVSRASRAYAAWCGTLLERLRNGFLKHWEKQKVELSAGGAHLPVLILQNRGQFREYAVRDGAAAAAETYGYYSARTNRVVLFDLTADLPGPALGDATQREEISRRLSRSPGSVATVVHEAVHQLAFNTGLQVRYADHPMWVSEGLAMYFETPDFGVGSRWTTVGKVNPWRLEEFQKSLGSRAEGSLAVLIRNEDRFRDPERMSAAYAESWMLVHYLASSRTSDWNAYLATLRNKPPLVFDSSEDRLLTFKKAFGDDLESLDRAMIRHARSLSERHPRP